MSKLTNEQRMFLEEYRKNLVTIAHICNSYIEIIDNIEEIEDLFKPMGDIQ